MGQLLLAVALAVALATITTWLAVEPALTAEVAQATAIRVAVAVE
jgi:hypothetical protein